MPYVEIYKLENNGSQKVIVVCKLGSDGKVICEGDKKLVEYLLKEGIRDYSKTPPEIIYPKEGRIFLEQLRYNFKSGYINASDVKEE